MLNVYKEIADLDPIVSLIFLVDFRVTRLTIVALRSVFYAVGQVRQKLGCVYKRFLRISLPFLGFIFIGRTSYVGAFLFANVGIY